MIIQVCVGSSCHLKGSMDIVGLLKKAIEDNHLERDVTLAGRCNRNGVTITVDDDVYPGVTKEGFRDFFQEKVLAKLK